MYIFTVIILPGFIVNQKPIIFFITAQKDGNKQPFFIALFFQRKTQTIITIAKMRNPFPVFRAMFFM